MIEEKLSALYFDVATWEQFRTESPYPFSRLYRVGQSFVAESKTWVVVGAWLDRGSYLVLCSRTIPMWLADSLQKANAERIKSNKREPLKTTE